jgi:predicted nuclease of predicted toxin-antitoxin system
MARAADEEILASALRERATLVTLDADFHAILAEIWLRMQGSIAPETVDLFSLCWLNS